MEFVEQKITEPTDEQRRHGIELVLEELARNGVTSAQDNSAWEDFLVYHQLKEEKKLTVRITEWLPFMAPVTELHLAGGVHYQGYRVDVHTQRSRESTIALAASVLERAPLVRAVTFEFLKEAIPRLGHDAICGELHHLREVLLYDRAG